MAALIAYCSIVLGSLMTDFGKASKAEANFRIALYKGGQSRAWVSKNTVSSLYYGDSTLPRGKLAISGLTNKETLLSAERTKRM